MTLRLLKPTVPYLRTSLVQSLPVRDEPRVKRLRGSALQSMRHRVLVRSGFRCECEQCRTGFAKAITMQTFELDHIHRVDQGGSNAIGNLRALHVDCHARITARQNTEKALYGVVLPEQPVQHRTPQSDDPDDMPC
jgi:5-methylcytosine-specific restriction protein A